MPQTTVFLNIKVNKDLIFFLKKKIKVTSRSGSVFRYWTGSVKNEYGSETLYFEIFPNTAVQILELFFFTDLARFKPETITR